MALREKSFHRAASALPRRLRHRVYGTLRPGYLDWIASIETEERGGYSLRAFDELDCLFIHVPKAAGISWCRALFGNLAGGHLTATKYLAFYGARRFDAMFKFAVLREPVDRARSAHAFLSAGGINASDAAFRDRVLSKCADFDDFVLNALEDVLERQIHFVPQWRFVTDPRTDRSCLDLAVRFEAMGEAFGEVARRLGRPAALGWRNRTPVARPAVGERALEALARIYAEDFARLGYPVPDPGAAAARG